MNPIIHEINLNLSKPNNFQLIHAMQGDYNAEYVKATLYDDNQLYTIHCDSIAVKGTTPDGHLIMNDVESFDEHTVTFKLSQNMLAADGDLTFSLVLYDDNSQKSTFDSIIKVINAPEGQAAESELTAITNLLSKAHEYEMLSKSYAIGTNDEIRENDSKDNAKYYAEQAKQSEQAIAANAAAAAENAAKAEEAASNARISELNAKASETNSAQYEQGAKESADNAKQSETAAATSAAFASESMESAKEANENAMANATLAANAASSAETSRDDAKNYADQAAISAANSSVSEVNAKASEENAAISEINAAASETNAKASEDHATESAVNAAASAAASAEAAKNSSNSSENAAASAASAASSAEEAAASADNAATSVNSAKEYAVRAEDAAKQAENIAGGDFVTKEEFAEGLAVKIDSDKIGAADGLATLGENGKVPTEQLPDNLSAAMKITELSAEDLNTITEPGFYAGRTDNTCSNLPEQKAGYSFSLAVLRSSQLIDEEKNHFSIQIIAFGNTNAVIYYRQYMMGTWLNWQYLYGTDTPLDKTVIGLYNVDNTADADKNVNSAQKDGKGNIITETYAKGSGIEFSIDENGILNASYDDGTEEGA